MRFFDIPKEYGNEIQGNNVESGLQARYMPFPVPTYAQIEMMGDIHGHFCTNLTVGYDLRGGQVVFDIRISILFLCV